MLMGSKIGMSGGLSPRTLDSDAVEAWRAHIPPLGPGETPEVIVNELDPLSSTEVVSI
jgi:hypothetical protein